MGMRSFIATVLTLCPVAVAQAHPHVFVDVELAVIYDNGTPVGVQVDWTYDDYFSLLLLADLGLDLDGDMQLTDAAAGVLGAPAIT